MGTAQAFQQSLSNEPVLIAAALVAVYIVLGVLYESLIHPITILSTLPSAGVGALLALLMLHTELTVIALIGIILLIGIVKKNAIMMIDFALEAERKENKGPEESIFQACILRFRPITMTTMAALLGGLPLAIGGGTGSELRRPLGISIVGGLIFSQMLTLYTTPVIYLYLDRMRLANRKVPRQDFPETCPGGVASMSTGRLRSRFLGLLATRCDEDALTWRRHSCLLGRDSSRRLADIDTSVDAARRSACATAVLLGLTLFTSGCMVGPKYSKPAAPAPPAFKEQPPPEFKEANNWKPGEPRDDKLRGNWWKSTKTRA